MSNPAHVAGDTAFLSFGVFMRNSGVAFQFPPHSEIRSPSAKLKTRRARRVPFLSAVALA